MRVTDTLKVRTPEMKASALKLDDKEGIGEEQQEDIPDERLFRSDMVGHVVTMWVLTPLISAGASFTVFMLLGV